jgi:hypothetical protein
MGQRQMEGGTTAAKMSKDEQPVRYSCIYLHLNDYRDRASSCLKSRSSRVENSAQDNTVRVLNQFGSVVSAKEADRVGCLRNPQRLEPRMEVTKSAVGKTYKEGETCVWNMCLYVFVILLSYYSSFSEICLKYLHTIGTWWPKSFLIFEDSEGEIELRSCHLFGLENYQRMWVKQCHKPPMTGNVKHTTHRNGDD